MIPEKPLRDVCNKENSVIKKNSMDVPLHGNQRNELSNRTQPGIRQDQSNEKEQESFNETLNKVSDMGYNEGIHKYEVTNQNILANESIKNVKSLHYYLTLERDTIEIIRNSLLNISDILNLNITATPALDENVAGVFSDHFIEQISEIIFSLKGLTDLLDSAVKNNVTLDMKGISVNPEIAAKLFSDLRSEIFNLEMAFKMAGITEDVTRKVTEKMDKPFVVRGITQAVDPQSLSMPQSQLRQLFENQEHGSKNQIDAIIGRIIALVKEEEKPDISNKKLITINGLKHGNNVINESSTDCHSVNSQVLRRLLKIREDVETNQGGQNKGTISEEKPKKTWVPNIFLDTKGAMKQSSKEFIPIVKESSDTLSGIDVSPKSHGQVSFDLNSKISSAIPRSIEESIITQVTQRFQSAIKNGVHEIRLVLRPESLGDVRMTIQMEGDIVTARIQVENQQVKQIIEYNLNNLKDTLEEQNLHAGSFDVNINRNSKDDEQDFDELAKKANSSEKNADKDSDVPDGNNKNIGVNTGRRFGSNSVEYYA